MARAGENYPLWAKGPKRSACVCVCACVLRAMRKFLENFKV